MRGLIAFVLCFSFLFLVDFSRCTAQVRWWQFLRLDSRMATGLISWLMNSLTFLFLTRKSDRSMALCSMIYKGRCCLIWVVAVANIPLSCLLGPYDILVAVSCSLLRKSLLWFRVQKLLAARELREKRITEITLSAMQTYIFEKVRQHVGLTLPYCFIFD